MSAVANEPFAPQRDLSPNELRSGFGYGPGVSIVDGQWNPSGRRGLTLICLDAEDLTAAIASASFGADIVTTDNATFSGNWTVPVMGAITATTPRQPPKPMLLYTRSDGLLATRPNPMSVAPGRATSVASMSAVTIQGDPSYIRIMSAAAASISIPPPHTTWHVDNDTKFTRLVPALDPTAGGTLLGTPDGLKDYRNYGYWRMEGLRLVNNKLNLAGFTNIWGTANSNAADPAPKQMAPQHIIYERCYQDGDNSGPGVIPFNPRGARGHGALKGVHANVEFFGFLNGQSRGCWVDQDYNLECNAILGGQGIGPHHLANSVFSGSGEGLFYNPDHGTNQPPPHMQSDLTLTQCWVTRPLSWRSAIRRRWTPDTLRATCATNTANIIASFDGWSANQDAVQSTDYFYFATIGRPVRIASYNQGTTTATLVASYSEAAGQTATRCVVLEGPVCLDGLDAATVSLGGSGNRTVTGVGTTWLTTLKPHVDAPPPFSGVFFGVNNNLRTLVAASTLVGPLMRQIASVDSDTQLTLAEDFTAGTFTGRYYTVSFWDGEFRSVMKNLHEMKGTNRMRAVGNVYENAWSTFNGQGGNMSSMNTAGEQYTHDGLYQYNLYINGGLPHYVTSVNFVVTPREDKSLARTSRVRLAHNLMVNICSPVWDVYADKQFPVPSGPQDLFFPASFNDPDATKLSGILDYQNVHNTVVADSSYQRRLRTIRHDGVGTQATPSRMIFQNNITHVGSHSGAAGGFLYTVDAHDFDGFAVSSTIGFNEQVPLDCVLSHNVLMRNSAPVIAPRHFGLHGGFNAGVASESAVGFTAYSTPSGNVPIWKLTQSVEPLDYVLVPVHTTAAGGCTVLSASPSFAPTFVGADAESIPGTTAITGTRWGIRANQSVLTGLDSAPQVVSFDTAMASDHHEAEITLVSYFQFNDQRVGIIARNDGAADTYYYWRTEGLTGGNNFRLGKVVAGTDTSLAVYNGADSGDDTAAGRRLKLRVFGNSQRGVLDGIEVATASDTAIPTGTHVGLYGMRPGVGDAVAVNFFRAGATGSLVDQTVTLTSGTVPDTINAGTPFRVSSDSASMLTRVRSRDSSTQVTLVSHYPGVTGAGMTGVFTFQGSASDGTDPGPDLVTLKQWVGNIRT